MTAELVFVDTNVLVYAYDGSAGSKHERAKSLVSDLSESGNGATSTQVLQEFYATVTRKIRSPISHSDARAIVDALRAWDIYANGVDEIVLASELAEHSLFSFWDALIVQAAIGCGASRLLTEDLHDGFKINQVVIENPFAQN